MIPNSKPGESANRARAGSVLGENLIETYPPFASATRCRSSRFAGLFFAGWTAALFPFPVSLDVCGVSLALHPMDVVLEQAVLEVLFVHMSVDHVTD